MIAFPSLPPSLLLLLPSLPSGPLSSPPPPHPSAPLSSPVHTWLEDGLALLHRLLNVNGADEAILSHTQRDLKCEQQGREGSQESAFEATGSADAPLGCMGVCSVAGG